jgi:hypothetical protein
MIATLASLRDRTARWNVIRDRIEALEGQVLCLGGIETPPEGAASEAARPEGVAATEQSAPQILDHDASQNSIQHFVTTTGIAALTQVFESDMQADYITWLHRRGVDVSMSMWTRQRARQVMGDHGFRVGFRRNGPHYEAVFLRAH